MIRSVFPIKYIKSHGGVGDLGFSENVEVPCKICGKIFNSAAFVARHEVYCLKKKEAEESGHFEEEVEDEPWLDGGILECNARSYADMALSYLNARDPSKEYKLVKPGQYQLAGISGGRIVHFNVKVKPNDGPVETFFGQAKTYFKTRRCELQFCLSVGFSEDLPPWGCAYKRCCRFCTYGVHHPPPELDHQIDGELLLGHSPLLHASFYNMP